MQKWVLSGWGAAQAWCQRVRSSCMHLQQGEEP